MFKTVSKVYLFVLVLSFTGCTNAQKVTSNDINDAVLEKITNAVKNQVLFQEIMLDDSVMKLSPVKPEQTSNDSKTVSMEHKISTDVLEKDEAVEDNVILAYSLHPKYFYWKAKNDPAMNLILLKVDKFVDKLKIRLSDVKQVESDKGNTASTCSANVSMGHDKIPVKYTVTDANNGKLVIEIKDSSENGLSSHASQPVRGSVFALCNTWENIKPTTFPPDNPQIIANNDDMNSHITNKVDIRFGTIIPLDLMVDGNDLNKELRSYKILQKQRSANNATNKPGSDERRQLQTKSPLDNTPFSLTKISGDGKSRNPSAAQRVGY